MDTDMHACCGRIAAYTLFASIALIQAADAKACECVGQSDDEEAAMYVAAIPRAAGAIEGVVVRSTDAIGAFSTATVRPTRVWFGERREHYLIKSESMCDTPLRTAEKVTLLLFPLEQDRSIWGWLGSILRFDQPLYAAEACSRFRHALRDERVRRALVQRARKLR